jgi:delta 1-pyrroline-5-carboxylate dehydrogenase
MQTRIDSRALRSPRSARVGNVYVNRNMIGAVVGVQPFGGEGLSGTGPKAGGPHYLYRFCAEQTLTINTAAAGGNAALLAAQIFLRQARHARHVTAYRLLQRVAGVQVAVQRQPVLHAVRQEARMLAAAVVVPLVHRGRRRPHAQLHEHGDMAAALQLAVVHTRLVQHALHLLHMHGFAAVAGAQQRQLRRAEAKLRRATATHERQRLQGLEGGAGEHAPPWVAHGGQQLAARIHRGHGAKVQGFGRAATGEFDQGCE